MIAGKNIQTLIYQLIASVSRLIYGSKCVGYATIDLSNANLSGLPNIPLNAQEAYISFEMGLPLSPAGFTRVAYTLDGSLPSNGVLTGQNYYLGAPAFYKPQLDDEKFLNVIEGNFIVIRGRKNLQLFRVRSAISYVPPIYASLKITYFN